MEKVRLGDLVDFSNGYAFKSSDYIDDSNTLNCRMSNIRPDGSFDIKYNAKYLPDTFIKKYSDYILKDGDLIIAMTDMAGDPKILGIPTIVKTEGYNVLMNQRVGKLTIKTNDILPDFLKYSLSSNSVREYFKSFAGGGLQLNIGKKEILNTSVCICDITKQKQIVEKLDRITTIINKRKEQLTKLDELVKARFVELFGDPVSNTKNLPKKTLAELGELGRGVSKHRPRNAPELLGGKYPLIQTGEVANSELYITSYENTYSEIGFKQSKMWDAGTLCITIAANIAKTAILTFDACFPDSVVGFNANEQTNNIFIHYWFSFFQAVLEAQAPESAQKNINLKVLSELEVIVPSIEEQMKFVAFVEQTDKSKLEVQKSLEKLELLKKALMQKYFGG